MHSAPLHANYLELWHNAHTEVGAAAIKGDKIAEALYHQSAIHSYAVAWTAHVTGTD